MYSTGWRKNILILALFFMVSLISQSQTTSVVNAASALTQVSETVACANSDFLIQVDKPSTNDEGMNALRLPFLEFFGGLASLDPSATKIVEQNYSTVLGGFKEFASPSGFGMVSSRKVYVAVDSRGANGDIDSVFQKAKQQQIDGRQVWTWSAPGYEGHPAPTPFYAARLDRFFVLSNNLYDFRVTVISLLHAASLTEPLGVPSDWEKYSGHPYWIHRVIQRQAVTDRNASGLRFLPDDVSEIMFYADPDKRESVIQVLRSNVTDTNPPQILPTSEIKRIVSEQPGVWRASIPISPDHRGVEAFVWVLDLFGFALQL